MALPLPPRVRLPVVLAFVLCGCELIGGIVERGGSDAGQDAGSGGTGAIGGAGAGGAGAGGASGVGGASGASGASGAGGASGVGGGGTSGDAGVDGAVDASTDADAAGTDASDGGTATGTHLWSKSFGSSGDQTVRSATVDAQGNLVVFGVFSGVLDFGKGPLTSAGARDLYVVKFDPAGNALWSKRYGDSADQACWGHVAVDAQHNVLISCDFIGTVDFGDEPRVASGVDALLLKLAPDGTTLFSKAIGDGANQYGGGIAADAAGNIIWCGHDDGGGIGFSLGGATLTNLDNKADAFVASYTAAGAHRWSRRFSPANAHLFCSAALALDGGDFVVTGNTEGALDVGTGTLPFGGLKDVYLARLAGTTGNAVWGKCFGDADWQGGTRLVEAPQGRIVLAGQNLDWVSDGSPAEVSFGGPTLVSYVGAFMAWFGADGSYVDSRLYDGIRNVGGIDFDASGNYLLAGRAEVPIDLGGGTLPFHGGPDAVIGKWSAGGGHLWSKSFGGASEDEIDGAGFDPSGNVIIAGHFSGGIDLGGGLKATNGAFDTFIAKFQP